MNFQILPKSTSVLSVDPSLACAVIIPFISPSYFTSLISTLEQLKHQIEEDSKIENVLNVINPFLSVFEIVKGKQRTTVSKLPIKSCSVYAFQEIFVSFHFNRSYSKFIYYGDFLTDFEVLIKSNQAKVSSTKEETEKKLIWFDVSKTSTQDNKLYALTCVHILEVILREVETNDSIVITLDHLFIKPVIDFIYIVTTMFQKVGFTKPTISNPTTFEKFLICQHFSFDSKQISRLQTQLTQVKTSLQINDSLCIASLLTMELPAIFLNKIDDINVIFGQAQLETLHQIISLKNSKNKDERIETMQKNGIQKSTQWCEKFEVPFYRLSDKPNIFKENLNDMGRIIGAPGTVSASTDVIKEEAKENI
jgi:hypothetical protein